MSEANQITNGLLVEIPRQFPNIRVWRSNRVKAMAIGRGGRLRMISAGIDGQGDITGLLSIYVKRLNAVKALGIRLEIEVKAGNDRQSAVQKAFQQMIEQLGGEYILARDVQTTLLEIENRARDYARCLAQE